MPTGSTEDFEKKASLITSKDKPNKSSLNFQEA